MIGQTLHAFHPYDILLAENDKPNYVLVMTVEAQTCILMIQCD